MNTQCYTLNIDLDLNSTFNIQYSLFDIHYSTGAFIAITIQPTIAANKSILTTSKGNT